MSHDKPGLRRKYFKSKLDDYSMKESYIKNNSHNYGDSRHSVTLENVVYDNSHCTFRSGVCTRLVSDVIRKPYAASVWVREIAG
jgi:hypothetical protein